MILTCEQMKEHESRRLAEGVDAAHLMEKAGRAIADVVVQFHPRPGKVTAFCGKGNNAGDVLVAARELAKYGWIVAVEPAFPVRDFAPLPRRYYDELIPHMRSIEQPDVVLDGLLGVGATGEPRKPLVSAIARINSLRDQGSFTVAADLPSGLDSQTGRPATACVEADLTVTIAIPKSCLVADAATNVVGRLAVAPLSELEITSASDSQYDDAELVTPSLLVMPPRPFESHKETWGRVGIIAGSRGLVGAGRLCSEAALRSGAGLVTLYATSKTYDLLATACVPEVMVKPISSIEDCLEDNLDAIAIGPGLGSEVDEGILRIIREAKIPLVIDADGLNCLSRHPEDLANLAPERPTLLTPHPGEFARLAPDLRDQPRRQAAEAFAARTPATLLLKGARTVIATRGRPTRFNTTGNPGMGSGGMGDVLTGVCATLLAQHHHPHDTASLAAWLCGRSAEFAIFSDTGSPESLAATDVIHHLGQAFTAARKHSM